MYVFEESVVGDVRSRLDLGSVVLSGRDGSRSSSPSQTHNLSGSDGLGAVCYSCDSSWCSTGFASGRAGIIATSASQLAHRFDVDGFSVHIAAYDYLKIVFVRRILQQLQRPSPARVVQPVEFPVHGDQTVAIS